MNVDWGSLTETEKNDMVHSQVDRAMASRFPSRPRRQPEAAVVEEPGPLRPKRATIRMGQVSLIRSLLARGLDDAAIVAEVARAIPAFPSEKVPKLIKINRSTVRKAGA